MTDHKARVPQLPPLLRLSRDDVRIEAFSETHLAVALYSRGGALYFQKVPLLDLPNDFIGIEDLERAGVLHVYVAAVEKLIGGGATMTGDIAPDIAKLSDRSHQNDRVAPSIVPLRRKAFNFLQAILHRRTPRTA